MVGQGKAARYMDMPTPCMETHLGGDLDQSPYHPFQRPANWLHFQIELPDDVEKIVGNDPHEEPCLVCLELSATGLVPAKGELAFLDPVFHVATPVVDPDHLIRWKLRVGDDETDSGKEFPGVPFDLADDTTRLIPFGRNVLEVDDTNLRSVSRWSSYRASKVGLDVILENGIGG